MKRILFGILMTITLTATVFAQRGGPFGPPLGGAQRGQRPDPTTGLKNALNLTDAQVDAIKSLLQVQQQQVQSIMTEIQQKRQGLNALLDAASPNPTDVGNAAIALRASERKVPGLRDPFLSQLKALLTGDQQQKLDTILAANPRLPLLGLGGPGFGGPGPRGQRPQ